MTRRGVDPGREKVEKWISRWYGDPFDLKVDVVAIPCTDMLIEANVGRQSALHAYLKSVAFSWLKEQCPKKKIFWPRFEVQMYFPIDELIELADEYNFRRGGSSFDIRKAQVLKKGDKSVDATHGEIIIVDVLGNQTSVEVGFTTPYNLCKPILEGLSETAVWLPFPIGIDPKAFSAEHCDLAEVVGYRLRISNGRQT